MTSLRLMILSILVAGCDPGTNACRESTLLLTVNLSGGATSADSLAVQISIGGAAGRTFNVPVTPGTSSGTIEVTFPSGYPAGQSVTATVTANQGGTAVGTGAGSTTLSSACGSLSVDVSGGGGGGDMATDFAGCVPKTMCDPGTVCGKPSDGCGGMLDCGPCQFTSLDRPLAATGETVTLEGKFNAPVRVTFPGGMMANATVLGANRVSIVVPASAGEGLLSVESNGQALPGLPFRRITYTVDVGAFRDSYEQADYARKMDQLSAFRFWAAAVATPRYVWILGGGTGAGDTVTQAMVNADGTLGAIRNLTGKLATPRAEHAALRIGDFVYVFGGHTNGGSNAAVPISSVERAPINADGTIGAFAIVPNVSIKATITIGVNTHTGRWGHSAHVIGNHVYLVGGSVGTFCSASRLSTIERALIKPDGSLEDFQMIATMTTTQRSSHAAVVLGDQLYLIGGETVTGSTTTVERSPIMPDGTLGGFVAGGGPLPQARAHMPAYAFGNTIFVLGGTGAATVIKATVQGDGTLSGFTTTAISVPVSGTAYNRASAVVGNYLYVFGGGDTNTCSAAFLSGGAAVQRASLQSASSIGAFAQNNMVNPGSPNRPAHAVIGNRLYLLGGLGTAPDVEVATVGPDGQLGNFMASTSSFVTKRQGFGAAVIGNNLYIVGGSGTGGPLGTVEVAPINADGSLGAFALAKANGTGANIAIPTGRASLSVAVLPRDRDDASENDQLCLFATGNVDCAVINEDGTLAGNFAGTGIASIGDGLMVTTGGRIYDLTNGAGAYQSAPVGPDGLPSAAFTAGPAVTQGPMSRNSVVAGNGIFIVGGFGGLSGSESAQVSRSLISNATGNFPNFADSGVMFNFRHTSPRAAVIGTRLWVVAGGGPVGAVTEVAELR
jgi:hypothetical protein